ncbi:MAG: hypothetical protein EBU70_14695 [Actinobacteria bacterium]|nr:hypothetical protein [Actinomycetota bacterium]
MRCKGCGYSLWNVAGRTCPECGRGFVPGEFEFVPNAVEFCCPACMQQYYGTGPDGLPSPREFSCVRCGSACSLDAMVLRPAPGVAPDGAAPSHVPWEREGVAAWKRLFGTARDALVRPASLGRAIAGSEDVGAGPAARFVVVLALLCSVSAAAVLWCMEFLLPQWFASPSRSLALSRGMWSGAAEYLAVAVGVAGAISVLPALAAGAALAVLRLLGVRVAWTAAWRCFAYSSGVAVLASLPGVGVGCLLPAVPVWWAVSTILALANGARAPAWKAASAVLLPPATAAVAGAALLLGLATWTTSAPPPPPAVTPSPASPSAPPPSP